MKQNLENGFLLGNNRFFLSADHQHVFYVVSHTEGGRSRQSLVWDGQEEPAFDSIEDIIVSERGGHYAYIGTTATKEKRQATYTSSVVADGKVIERVASPNKPGTVAVTGLWMRRREVEERIRRRHLLHRNSTQLRPAWTAARPNTVWRPPPTSRPSVGPCVAAAL